MGHLLGHCPHSIARSAAMALALLGAAACDSVFPNEHFQNTPVQTGNTLDRFNDLSVTFPRSSNVSISYAFEFDRQGEISTANQLAGPNWLYVERTAADPEIFLQIHLITPGEASVEESGTLVRLGSKRFQSQLFCIDPLTLDTSELRNAVLKPYLTNVRDAGYEMSRDVFIRRYVEEELGIDGRRIDVVYVHDLTRSGYSCADIGDPREPAAGFEDLVETLNESAARSWEIAG